jgi:hypothetical protein
MSHAMPHISGLVATPPPGVGSPVVRPTQLGEIHTSIANALNSAQMIRSELYDLVCRLGLGLPASDGAARPSRGDAAPHRIMDATDVLNDTLGEIERLATLLRDHG